MNEENKELLIKDLCGRLPYKVKIRIDGLPTENHYYFLHTVDTLLGLVNSVYFIERIKPYLFPMSSMTKEQMNELLNKGIIIGFTGPKNIEDSILDIVKWIDYLNKNHFDYRGLIDKNLAIDCTDLNIY